MSPLLVLLCAFCALLVHSNVVMDSGALIPSFRNGCFPCAWIVLDISMQGVRRRFVREGCFHDRWRERMKRPYLFGSQDTVFRCAKCNSFSRIPYRFVVFSWDQYTTICLTTFSLIVCWLFPFTEPLGACLFCETDP